MEPAEQREISLNVVFGEVEAADNPIFWKLRVDIGKQSAGAVIDQIKAESGEDPTMNPVVWLPTDNEDAAEKLLNLIKDVPGALKFSEDEKEEYDAKIEGLVRPDFKRNGATLVINRQENLEEFVPLEMINEMIGPCQELVDNSNQSIEISIQSDVNGGEALQENRNFEFELFKNARLNFAFKFDKDLIFKVLETAANNLGQEEQFNQFRDALQVVSQMLVHYKLDLEFRSSDDIPANVQKLFKQNLPQELRLKKMLALSHLTAEEREKAGPVLEALTGVAGPLNIGIAVGDWATVRITAQLKNTFGVVKELVLSGKGDDE